MPARSKVLTLPPDVREALNTELTRRGFQDYDGLSEWLAERGFEISKSALHRYGSGFERRLATLQVASEQARTIVSAMGDDEGRMGEALTSLVQQKAFEVLVEMESAEDVGLIDLGHMVARLNATAVAQKRWAQQVTERTERAATEVVELASRGGLSDETAEVIRRKILGIAA